MERLTSSRAPKFQSAECSSATYYQSWCKSPRTWTCTATFRRARVDTGTPACATFVAPTGWLRHGSAWGKVRALPVRRFVAPRGGSAMEALGGKVQALPVRRLWPTRVSHRNKLMQKIFLLPAVIEQDLNEQSSNFLNLEQVSPRFHICGHKIVDSLVVPR